MRAERYAGFGALERVPTKQNRCDASPFDKLRAKNNESIFVVSLSSHEGEQRVDLNGMRPSSASSVEVMTYELYLTPRADARG